MQPGFIAAMKSECRMLSNSPLPGRATRLSNGALLVLSGIGRNHAAAGAEVLIKEGATAVISWGFAAGLARGVGPGTLILPERIISRDRETLLSDRLIYELIRNSLSDRIPHLRGALAESSRILKSSDEKKLLFQKTGALAADMESAAVAEAANAVGLPFLAVRVILDSSTNTMPTCALASIGEYGGIRFSRFIRNLSPREIRGLSVLALNQWKARATLKRIGKAVSYLKF